MSNGWQSDCGLTNGRGKKTQKADAKNHMKKGKGKNAKRPAITGDGKESRKKNEPLIIIARADL